MDSDDDQPYLIPQDPWDTEHARAYHYGAAQASSQPAAPYNEEPNAWQEWAANQTTFTGMQADHDFTARDSAQRNRGRGVKSPRHFAEGRFGRC